MKEWEKPKGNPMSINAMFGFNAAKETVGTIEDRVKASMRAVLENNYLENEQRRLFQASIAGALMTCETGDHDWHQLVDSMDAVYKVGAFLEVVKLGFKAGAPALGEHVTLPLVEWWHEVFAVTKSKVPTR